jgi:steroid delta-isomerase-like uncharacterized protein
MDSEDKKRITRRFYEEYDRDDRQALASLLAPNCQVHLPGVPEPLSREAYLAVSAQFADAFSDSKTLFEDEIAEGDTAVLRWCWEITHSRRFWDIAPSGKRVTVRGVTINRLAEGKIVEQWVSFDQLAFLQQLVALP